MSTASVSYVTNVRPNLRERGSEVHNIAVVLIENPNITARIGSTAEKVSATVTFFTDEGTEQVSAFPARWWDEIESDLYVGDESPKHLQLTTIAPGTKSHLAIAEQIKNSNILYAYNAESHHFDNLRKKEFKLGSGKFYARIQLAAEGIEPPKPIWVSARANKKEDRIDLEFETPKWAKRLKV